MSTASDFAARLARETPKEIGEIRDLLPDGLLEVLASRFEPTRLLRIRYGLTDESERGGPEIVGRVSDVYVYDGWAILTFENRVEVWSDNSEDSEDWSEPVTIWEA